MTGAGSLAVPLGAEVKVQGARQVDGAVLARSIDVKSNGEAFLEGEAQAAAAETEQTWLQAGRIRDEEDDLGRVVTRGSRVERVRRVLSRLFPPYVDPGAYRVYVVVNEEWNAMAMANGAIWVFSGLLDAMDETRWPSCWGTNWRT